MSTASESASQIVAALQETLIDDYVQLACSVIVFYEHTITLSQEIRFFWKARLTGATCTFFINRYVLFLQALFTVIPVPSDSAKGCEALGFIIPTILAFAGTIIVGAFSVLRVLAISRNNYIALFVFLLTVLVPVATNLYSSIDISYAYILVFDNEDYCYQTSYESNAASNKLEFCTAGAWIIADAIILVTTWYHNYSLYREALHAKFKTSLIFLILRDGTLYFIVMLIIHVLQMWLNYRSNTTVLDGTFFSSFLLITPSILISRFLFNLRGTVDDDKSPEETTSAQLSSLQMVSRLTGNMGASLVDSSFFDTRDDEDEGEEQEEALHDDRDEGSSGEEINVDIAEELRDSDHAESLNRTEIRAGGSV